ncbi:MAG TPA: glycosyltransferase family 9 protein [Bacteroidota bacterium]|nr:glycosyltransferase family 9 protein [Bacteroidota bacterium]
MQGVLHKTLVIRLSSVGDIVLSSPLLRSLHRHFPDCQIDFLVKSEYADLVRHNAHVARVLEFPPRGTLGDVIRMRRTVQQSRYDLIIDIHDSIRSRLIAAGARDLCRVNKRKIARTLLILFKIDCYARFGGSPGVAERYLETVARFGVHADALELELFYPEESRRAMEAMLGAEGIPSDAAFIAVCPASRHANKIWPLERFAEAAGRLAAARALPVIIFGSHEERQRCSAVAEQIMRSCAGVRALSLAGRVSLLETAAAMDRCAIVLTNDTGLMHIASARGIPVVAIFGPTVRQFGFFPPERTSTVVEHGALSCRPCTHIGRDSCPEGHFRCMKEISVNSVVAAAEDRMRQGIRA